MVATNVFSLRELYEALDERRRERDLSWAQVAREVGRRSERTATHPVNTSTITSTRTRAVAEGDGVLQMLLWLGRTPESFVPGAPDTAAAPLPVVAPHQILRFDTRKLHAAVDVRRREGGLTWAGAAREVGLGEAQLKHLAKGGRTAFPSVMRIVRWLGWPAADFTRAADN